MKAETLIYEKILPVIPEKSEKTVFFTSVWDTGYEIFFYSFFDGKAQQCFQLAEQGILEENELEAAFREVADLIRSSKYYEADQNNLITLVIDCTGMNLETEHLPRDARMYQIKKEWKQRYIN